MTRKIPASAVPPLRLTAQDEIDLRELNVQLEQEIVLRFEDFLFRQQRGIDASKWKLARSDGDIHAFKEHHVKQRLRRTGSFVSGDASKTWPGPQEILAQQSVLPRILVTGTVPGTLDDVMYGMSFHDTPSLQAFWAGQRDSVEESAVVATIDGPTLVDPYRFLGAVWLMRSFPFNIFQHRDLLVLASSGITHLSNGERVGVVIGHSIEHRDLPELHELNTIRATSSILKVFRQLDTGRVEMYMIHSLDTKGSVPEVLHVRETLAYLMSLAASLNNIGFRKKLASLVEQRKRADREAAMWDAIEPRSSGVNDNCEACDKKLDRLFSFSGTACQLCFKRICSRCCVSHDLVVETPVGKPTLKAHDFCVQCSLHARTISTFKVAHSDTYDRSTASTSSFRVSTERSNQRLTTLIPTDSLFGE